MAQGQFHMSTGLIVLPELGSTLGKKYILQTEHTPKEQFNDIRPLHI